MRLTVNISTRGRPELLNYTIKQTLPNMALPSTTLLICVDQDDQPTLDSLKSLPKDDRIKISCRPREDTRGPKSDRALTEAPADLYLIGADYSPIITPAFDQIVINAGRIWPDGIGVVYSHMCDELVPILQCPTAKFVEKMGYIHNPDYPFWFIDHEMADIAQMIGRINFCDATADLSKRPAQTTRLRDLGFWTDYFNFMAVERRAKAREIIRDPEFQAPDWLKLQMCNWFPLVEKRSEVRNARVKQGPTVTARDLCVLLKQMAEAPPDQLPGMIQQAIEQLSKCNIREDGTVNDPGYVRAKGRAEQKASELYKQMTALRAAA